MLLRFTLVLLLAGSLALAQTTGPQDLHKTGKVVLQEVVIDGVTTMTTQQLNEIIAELSSIECRDDEDEIRSRVRDAFQTRGYMLAEVKSLKLKPLDPLARPKPLRVEAEVSEGPKFRIGEISFRAQAFPPERLRATIPVHTGDWFNMSKVRSGLNELRELYVPNGYLQAVFIPNVTLSNSTVDLIVDVDEGPQYRMGSLHLNGKSDLVEQLGSKWKLAVGDVFDGSYPQMFVNDNRSVFPSDFNYANDVHLGLDCPQATVTVQIDLDPRRPSLQQPKYVPCEKPEQQSK